jgi:preprotein translocase subunit SecE
VGAFVQELFSVGLYKRNQGRIARQATFGALALIVAVGCWKLSEQYADHGAGLRYGLPIALLALGLWASFRLVQLPSFADFLISVEGEMNKVSWPSRSELFRASLVVILVIFFLAALLFTYDVVLKKLLQLLENLIDWMFS